MNGMNALMPGEHDWLDKGNPSAPSVSPEPQKKSGLMNALGAVFKYGAPEAYDQGRQRKAIETMGNALSMGNYEDAAKAAFQSGNLDQGMQLRQYADSRQAAGAEQEAAMRQQQAQGTLSLFSQMEPDQIANFALEQPQEFERITGMSSDEYMQAGARMRQSGMDPAQFRQFVIQKAQAELGQMPEAPEYYAPVETDNGYAQFSKDGSDPRQFEGIAPAPEGPMSSMGKLAADLIAGRITQQQYDMEIARLSRPSSQVTVNTGNVSDGERPLVGKPPTGYQMIWDPQSGTYRQEVIPGSSVASEIEAQNAKDEKNLGGTELTVGNLINSYATLARNKAITARGNDAAENLGAMFSGTGVGKTIDRLGGDVGNLENAEARGKIEGLSMNALMKMISMSDVSAKAMDSDAEMKAWLSAIKDDNYEAALTKLHVLDKSFGNGRALQDAFANGVIDQGTYQYVTNRANSDPYTKQMADKASRYASLEGAIGADNLTPDEQAELEALRVELGVQ